jgi:hypothetical protein
LEHVAAGAFFERHPILGSLTTLRAIPGATLGDWGQVEIGCFTQCEPASRSAAFRSGASMVPSTWLIERVLK